MESVKSMVQTPARVLGIPVHDVKPEELEETLERVLEGEGVRPLVFLSLWDLLLARRNAEFRSWVEKASLVLPTSRGILRGARFLKKELDNRYYPFDVVIRLFGLLEKKGRSVYLLGGKPLYLEQAEKNLRQTFPGLKLVGRYPGYYPSEVEENILLAMRKASPHCVLLGPGLKQRERWPQKQGNSLPPSVVVYSPETFDIISGKRVRPDRETVEKGREYMADLFRKPWRVARGLFYLYYLVLLVVYRIQKR